MNRSQPSCCPDPVYLLPRPQPHSGQSTKIHPQIKKKKKSERGEQTGLCYVTAFVARLTPRSVLLQTVAALFPLRGDHSRGPGRDTGGASLVESDRRMPEEQKKLTTGPDGRPSVISSPDVCLESSWLKLQMRQALRAREPDLTRVGRVAGLASSDGPLWVHERGGLSFPQMHHGRMHGISRRGLTMEL